VEARKGGHDPYEVSKWLKIDLANWTKFFTGVVHSMKVEYLNYRVEYRLVDDRFNRWSGNIIILLPV